MDTTAMTTRRQCSRRWLLKGTGAAGLGLALAQAASWQPAAAQDDDLQSILNITSTTEAFGVTVLGAAITSAREGNYDQPIPDPVLAILEAARAEEQFHLDYFRGLGGELLVDSFTVPPALLTSYDAFFSTLVELEARETAAQIAAMMTFTQMSRPDLAKASFQYAAEESEHRVLANYALGVRPPNDIAFAPALYSSVAEHLAFLEESGIIGGTGTEITYPGPGDIDATGVTNTEPDGPEVSCAPGEAGGADGRGGGDDQNDGGGRADREGRGGGRDGQVGSMPSVGVGVTHGVEGMWAMLGLAGLAGAAAVTLRTRQAGLLAAHEGGPTSDTDA